MITLRRLLLRSPALVAVFMMPLAAATAPARHAPPDVRLYVLDCGFITSTHPEYFGVTLDDVGGNADMPVSCYLVRHPRGILLFDTGNGDWRQGKPPETGYGMTYLVPTSLASQLHAIGVAPADITYVAISHFHLDHVGNLAIFPHSTLLIQRAELDSVRKAPAPSTPASAIARLDQPGVEPVTGDHDVFGDGSVVLEFTPGHTLGHQSLLVRLHHSGTIVLSGDLYHYAAERALGKISDREKASASPESRARMEAIVAREHGQLWTGHDRVEVAGLRKAPAYYD